MSKAVYALRAIAIISAVGFLFYPYNFFSLVFGGQETQPLTLMQSLILFFFGYAWFTWFVMAVAWLFGKRLARYWPITGTIAGTVSVLFLSPLVVPVLLLVPSITLAITFCRFHMQRQLHGQLGTFAARKWKY